MSPKSAIATLSFTTALLIATLAYADRITLKNGRVVEGKVLARGSEITVKMANGITASFSADQVASIEEGPTRHEIYAEKAEAATDIAGHRRVARWCLSQKLQREAEHHFRELLKLDANDVEAHRALDHVFTKSGWQTRDAYMRSLGLVPFKGRWVKASELAKLEGKKAGRKEASKVRRLLRDAAMHRDEARRSKAQAELASLSDETVAYTFRRRIVTGNRKERKVLIADLEKRTDQSFTPLLVKTVVGDPSRTLRKLATEVLATRKDPDTALHFVKRLDNADPITRINATAALQRFPDRRAVSALIKTLRYESGGFGRAYVSFITQRAYIQDYELASGGTGLRVSEVADPVVGTFQEGVVLDVHVKKVEWEQKAYVLEYLTGRSHGINQGAWAKWWKSSGESFVLSEEAREDRASLLGKKS